MTPAAFDYLSPGSMEEALKLLQKYGEDAKILAGGQSLIPLMKMRFTSFPYIVDLSRIEELKFIKEEGGKLIIGAMTTNAELENSELARGRYVILHDASSNIADPLVRNMGTVGGNLSHGDPGNDLPAVMIALKALFAMRSASGTRTIDAAEFYKDTFVTAAGPQEMLVHVEIPVRSEGFSGAYVKHKRRAGDFSVAGVAVAFEKREGRRLANVGVGLTSVGPTAIHATKTEEWLEGKPADKNIVEKAMEIVREEAKPSTDFYGTAEYKTFVVGELLRRSIELAISRKV